MTPPPVDWQRVRAVVFDVDGTLYDQRALRRRMAWELAVRCLTRPTTLADARILSSFRALREALADEEATGIRRLQYERSAQRLGLPVARVEAVVEEWILRRPLRHVAACRSAGVRQLFSVLGRSGRRIGVWSDYPARGKLAALGLTADIVVSAVDPEVDRLKPHPAGLARVLERLEVSPAESLLIGDRDERDGEAARRFGCPYLLLSRRPSRQVEIAGYAGLLADLAAAERE